MVGIFVMGYFCIYLYGRSFEYDWNRIGKFYYYDVEYFEWSNFGIGRKVDYSL